MELEPYDLRDPQQLIGEVSREHPLVDGDLLIVLIDRPSTTQRVVAVRRVVGARWRNLTGTALSELLGEEAGAMPLSQYDRGVPHHLLLTILVRQGYAVIDATDGEVLSAWRYAHHFMPVFDGGILLVTEHGWYDFMSGCAGVEPALAV